MSELSQVLLNGIMSGSVYASLALALSLTYRATGIINFAQGEMAMFCTYVAWQMTDAGVNVFVAAAVTLVFALCLGAGIERAVIRRVQQAPQLTVLIVTLGIFLIFDNLAGWVWSYNVKDFPALFGDRSWTIGGAQLSSQALGSCAVLILETVALFAFFRFTRTGLAMRAVAMNMESSRLVGIRVGRVLMIGWALGAALGAIAGLLVAPTLFLQPSMMFNVLIYAFAAVTLGGFDSPVGAVVGGLFVGVVTELSQSYIGFIGNDLKLVVPLGLILLVLLVRPAGLFGTREAVRV